MIFLGNHRKLFIIQYFLELIGKFPCWLVKKVVSIENRNSWLSEDKLTFLSFSKRICFVIALTVGHGSRRNIVTNFCWSWWTLSGGSLERNNEWHKVGKTAYWRRNKGFNEILAFHTSRVNLTERIEQQSPKARWAEAEASNIWWAVGEIVPFLR